MNGVRDSPLRFGAFALGQQAGIWLRHFVPSPKFAPLRSDFRYPLAVRRHWSDNNRIMEEIIYASGCKNLGNTR